MIWIYLSVGLPFGFLALALDPISRDPGEPAIGISDFIVVVVAWPLFLGLAAWALINNRRQMKGK